ncbi:hypothetical protein Q8791_01030 [Nocardiopsis sp. CT-R113]|uniref:Fibronectin type-III domain-containing protein n=1 Tax=Nocardiopsis codii TaxID=3065942 RepID=A0ABU7K1S9_9ACTN|nr:hypothetical protein [Nocardiopsis sp. CT-R113]MEE2035804.1 hypothetical protein [Nocardiopsis sp. CT-R113]
MPPENADDHHEREGNGTMPWDAQDRRRYEDGVRVAEPLLPPPEARARVDGRDVVVSWQPSPSPAGAVTYRVARRTGRAGTSREVPVGGLSGTEITDVGAPVGAEVRYAVVAVRDGRDVSEAAQTCPVMITPEVCDLRVRADDVSVSASWRPPAEAVRVEVRRGEGAAPRGAGDGVRVETDGTGFRDVGVGPGAEYFYLVRAVYLTSDGHARASAGLLRRASPGPLPAPVSDLTLAADGGAGIRARWTRPSRGRVVLRVGPEAARWAPGTVVDPDELAAHGPEVLQEPGPVPEEGPGAGCERVELVLGAGTSHVLAATVAGDRAVVGDSVRITNAPPVEGLRAERFDTSVRLVWTWPDGAAAALVSWRPDPQGGAGDRSGVALRCIRRQYEADGGFEEPMGPDPVRVDVRAVVVSGGEEAVSAPASVTVPGRSVIAYHVEPVGLLRRARVVHLVAERACAMPEVSVVYAEGAVQPHSGAQGHVLATLSARPLRAGERVSVRVRPPRGAGPGWLMCFPAAAGDDGAAGLRQPSVKELRL